MNINFVINVRSGAHKNGNSEMSVLIICISFFDRASKGHTSKIIGMVKGPTHGQMAPCLKEHFTRTGRRAMENSNSAVATSFRYASGHQ